MDQGKAWKFSANVIGRPFDIQTGHPSDTSQKSYLMEEISE
jgi:hypothetical protein